MGWQCCRDMHEDISNPSNGGVKEVGRGSWKKCPGT